jgi:hypothetical protein
MLSGIARLTIIALLTAAVACNRTPRPSSPPSPPAEPVAKLTSDDLVKEYQQNELAADGKYKNKLVQVTGKVGKVGKHPLGYPFVQLGTGQEEDLFGVTCYLTEKATEEAAKLQPGETITVRGSCMGKLGGQALRLENCEIIKTDPAKAKPGSA